MSNLSQHIRSLAQSSTTPQTLLDIAEDVQELEAINAELEKWEEEARRFCNNADYWRDKYMALLQERYVLEAEKAINPASAGR